MRDQRTVVGTQCDIYILIPNIAELPLFSTTNFFTNDCEKARFRPPHFSSIYGGQLQRKARSHQKGHKIAHQISKPEATRRCERLYKVERI